MTFSARSFQAVGLIVVLMLTSCATPGFQSLINQPPPPGWEWVICPGGSASPTSMVIGAAGGTLTHPNGHQLVVPAGAVTSDHAFLLIEPPAQHMMVVAEVAPNVTFQRPITLVVSYDRCVDPPPANTLRIFRANPAGPHDDVGGDANQANRRITSGGLNRLSNYALATNR